MKKAGIIGLSVTLGVIGTAAIVTPTAILFQKKITKDVVKIQESEEFKNYKETLAKFGNDINVLKEKIELEKENWKSWLLPLNSDNVIVLDSIKNIEQVIITPISGNLSNFEIWFSIEWSSSYDVAEQISKLIKGFYLNDVWKNETFNWKDLDETTTVIQNIINDPNKRYTKSLELENDLNKISNNLIKNLINPIDKIKNLNFSVKTSPSDATKFMVEVQIEAINGFVSAKNLTVDSLTLNKAVNFSWTDELEAIKWFDNQIIASASDINSPQTLTTFLNTELNQAEIIEQITQLNNNTVVDAISKISFEVLTELNQERKYEITPILELKPGFGFGTKINNLSSITIKTGSFFEWQGGVKAVESLIQSKITENTNDLAQLQSLINTPDIKQLLSNNIIDPTKAIVTNAEGLKDVTYEVEAVPHTLPTIWLPHYKITSTPNINTGFPAPATPLPVIDNLKLVNQVNITVDSNVGSKLSTEISTSTVGELKDIYDDTTLLNYLNGAFQNRFNEFYTPGIINFPEIKPSGNDVIESIAFEAIQTANPQEFAVSSVLKLKPEFKIAQSPVVFNVTVNKLVELNWKNSTDSINFVNSEISKNGYTNFEQFNTAYFDKLNGIGYKTFHNQFQGWNELIFKDATYASKNDSSSNDFILEAIFETKNGYTNVNPKSTNVNKLSLNGIKFSQGINLVWKTDAKNSIQTQIHNGQEIATMQEFADFLKTTEGKKIVFDQIQATLKPNNNNAINNLDFLTSSFQVTKTSAEGVWPQVVKITPDIKFMNGYGYDNPVIKLSDLNDIVLNNVVVIKWLETEPNPNAKIQDLIYNQQNIVDLDSLNGYIKSPSFKDEFLNIISVLPNGQTNSDNLTIDKAKTAFSASFDITNQSYSITPNIVLNPGYKIDDSAISTITGMNVNIITTASWNNIGNVRTIIQNYINATSSEANAANQIDTPEKLESKLNSDTSIKNNLKNQIILQKNGVQISNASVSNINFSVTTSGASYKVISKITLPNGFVIENKNLEEILNINLVRQLTIAIGDKGTLKNEIQTFISVPGNQINTFEDLKISANTGGISDILESYIALLVHGIDLPEAARITFITTESTTPNNYQIQANIEVNPGFVLVTGETQFLIEGLILSI